MKTTKEQKKKIVFICFTIIITAFIIITIRQNPALKSNNKEVNKDLTKVSEHLSLCEYKLINDFQIIDPEFVREDNTIEQDSYRGRVIYKESEDQVKVTEYECKIGNNGNDVRINRDINNNPKAEDIIYDDWN